MQIQLFEPVGYELADRIRKIDVDSLRPIDALTLLHTTCRKNSARNESCRNHERHVARWDRRRHHRHRGPRLHQKDRRHRGVGHAISESGPRSLARRLEHDDAYRHDLAPQRPSSASFTPKPFSPLARNAGSRPTQSNSSDATAKRSITKASPASISGRRFSNTLQIGEGSVIAECTGIDNRHQLPRTRHRCRRQGRSARAPTPITSSSAIRKKDASHSISVASRTSQRSPRRRSLMRSLRSTRGLAT